MRDFNDLYFFAAVVRNEGFTAAARALGLPKSRLSRRIAILEEQLGVRLLERSTRKLRVTDIGKDIYRHAQLAIEQAEAVEEVALRTKSEPQGLVRISCPIGVQRAVSGSLPTLLKKYPKLRLQFLLSNRPVDLIAESVDIAVRIRERLDTDEGLQMRRIGISRRILVAARELLKSNDHLEKPDDLRRFPLIHATERSDPAVWELVGPRGSTATVQVRPKFSAGDFAMLLDAAIGGVGVALLPEIDCQQSIRSKQLVRVLRGWSIPTGIIHLVFPSRRGMLPGVRSVIEFLAVELKSTIDSK
jgi:DNA-binding transcriptional LysR family regulator